MDEEKNQGCCCRRDFIRNTALAGIGVLAMTSLAPSAFGEGKEQADTPVRIPDARIRMNDLDAFLVGVSNSEIVEFTLAEVLRFHGYCAAGVTLAFREAQEAFRVLYGDKLPVRQGIKVETAYHCCQAGALAYITGVRTDFGVLIGRGDLVLIPEEAKKVVFSDKKTGKSVTLLPPGRPSRYFCPCFPEGQAG